MPKRTDINKVLIIGSGPIIIGQACEFDMALHYALEALTLGGTNYVNELHIVSDDICEGDGVSELELTLEVCGEFHKLLLRGSSCLLKMTLEGRAGAFLFLFVIGKLNCFVTIGFNSANLRDNTRTSLDDGAWNILSISTEDGNHSDFLSN